MFVSLRLQLLRVLGLIAFAVAVLAVGKWNTTCRVLLSSLLVLPCSHFLLPHFSPSASSAELWASSTPVVIMSLFGCSSGCSPSSSTASRRPHVWSVVYMDPPSVSQPIMCLFDTSFSSCIEFDSFLSSTLPSRVVPSRSSSFSPGHQSFLSCTPCSSRASASLTSHSWSS